jgi:hypothetical protein
MRVYSQIFLVFLIEKYIDNLFFFFIIIIHFLEFTFLTVIKEYSHSHLQTHNYHFARMALIPL